MSPTDEALHAEGIEDPWLFMAADALAEAREAAEAEARAADGDARVLAALRASLVHQLGSVRLWLDDGTLAFNEAQAAMRGDFGRGYMAGLVEACAHHCRADPLKPPYRAAIADLYTLLFGESLAGELIGELETTDPQTRSVIFRKGTRAAAADLRDAFEHIDGTVEERSDETRLLDGLYDSAHDPGHDEDYPIDAAYFTEILSLNRWTELDGDALHQYCLQACAAARECWNDPVAARYHAACGLLFHQLGLIAGAIADGGVPDAAAREVLLGPFGAGYVEGLCVSSAQATGLGRDASPIRSLSGSLTRTLEGSRIFSFVPAPDTGAPDYAAGIGAAGDDEVSFMAFVDGRDSVPGAALASGVIARAKEGPLRGMRTRLGDAVARLTDILIP